MFVDEFFKEIKYFLIMPNYSVCSSIQGQDPPTDCWLHVYIHTYTIEDLIVSSIPTYYGIQILASQGAFIIADKLV